MDRKDVDDPVGELVPRDLLPRLEGGSDWPPSFVVLDTLDVNDTS